MVAPPKSPELDLPYRVLSLEEGQAMFDIQAREITGMSGDEFIAKWDAGEYFDRDLDADQAGRTITFLASLIPFARRRP